MNILVSVIISALMVLGSLAYVEEHKPEPLGANTMISALTTGTSLDDADHIIYNDNSGAATTKKITWANATSSLSTYFDAQYEGELNNSAGLLAALSDETGSGVAVFGTSPTITSATLTTPYINVSGTEATGDLFYSSDAGGTLSRLAVGSAGQALSVSGGVPAWSSSFITFPYTSSSTFTATTTFDWGSLTNNALVANGLAYKWPSTRGASSSVMMEDGSGNLVWDSLKSCDVYVAEDDTLSNSVGLTYVNYANTLGATSTIQRATWGYNEAASTASSGYGSGMSTSTVSGGNVATSSGSAINFNITAAGAGTGGGSLVPYLINLRLDDVVKLYGWVNYTSATNTQIAWQIRAADITNATINVEFCR